MQVEAPPKENVPGGHGPVHVSSVSPLVAPKYPAWQGKHIESFLYDPTAHPNKNAVVDGDGDADDEAENVGREDADEEGDADGVVLDEDVGNGVRDGL